METGDIEATNGRPRFLKRLPQGDTAVFVFFTSCG